MAYFLDLPTFNDNRGKLSVIENILPFKIKRVYFIYDVQGLRGGHKHKKTIQALVMLNGTCEIYVNDGIMEKIFILDNPSKCLILEPKDWHTMDKFSFGSSLLVLASETYKKSDYIWEM
jgi:hypothetical protein